MGQAETRVEMDEEKPDEVIYNERLGRFLNSKECSLRRAVIYFTYEFLYLIKVEVEWLIGRSVGLAETIKYFLTLAKQNNELYLFETKEVMV